jgi:predicted dehydrogenase
MNSLDLLIIGGGMITHDLILPSAYHLQRLGRVGRISVCALNSPPLRALAQSAELQQAFPGQSFEPLPGLGEPPDRMFPDLYRNALAHLSPRQAVIVAVPDQFHFEMVMTALEHDQHVLCVKPLVLQYEHAH